MELSLAQGDNFLFGFLIFSFSLQCPYGQENTPEQSKKKFNSAFYV